MNTRTIFAILTTCALGLAVVQTAAADDVHVLLTKVDDGDARRAAFKANTNAHFDAHQDDNYTLLRESTIPLLAGNATDTTAPLITIDGTKRFQTMLGLGAALTDASAFVLMELKAKNRPLYDHTMERLFSPTKGAGLSVLRLPMGSSDYVSGDTYFTYCDTESRDLSAFSIARDEQYVIPVLKDALTLNPELRLIGSPWSPPAWMKTNGSLLGTTETAKNAGTHNRLKLDCFGLYAAYFVKFVQAYQAAGINIYGLTLQNEPQFDTAAYPCLRMDEADQIKLVKELGPRLKAANLSTRIYIHDHNWSLHPNDRKPVGGDTKLLPVESVTKILSDPEAGPFIAGSAWHCYFGGVPEMREAYETMHKRFPDKQILTTEASAWGKNRGPWWGDVEWAMTHHFLGASQHWSEASLEWNLALDHKFGPTLRADSEGVGLVTIQTDTYQDAGFEREYYAMAQMSRAARPGAVKIAAQVDGQGSSLDVAAFALPGGKTTLTVFNRNEREQVFAVKAGDQRFQYSIPGHSIATFQW